MENDWSPCLQTLEGHRNWVSSVVSSHDHKYLASVSDDKTIKIWDLDNGKCLQTFKVHSDWAMSVVFSHNSNHLASASADGIIKIWDANDGKCLQTLQVGRVLLNISFDSTGSFLHTEIGTFILDFLSASMPTQSTADPKKTACRISTYVLAFG